MGITFSLLERLRIAGVFQKENAHVLDIGVSNLYQANADQICEFVRAFRPANDDSHLTAFAERFARGASYDPVTGGTNEAFLGELLEHCGMKYLAFDVSPGYKTDLLDINFSVLPRHYSNRFDVVLNIGTTEHVLNQFNAFEIIHNATRTGGLIVHELPISGHTNHGYFVYTGRLFFDMAGYNEYENVDVSYNVAGADDLFASARSYESVFEKLRTMAKYECAIPNAAIVVILRKTSNRRFLACLDVSTAASLVSHLVRLSYSSPLGIAKKAVRKVERIARRLSGRLWRKP